MPLRYIIGEYMPIAILLHANIQYAEIPFIEWDKVFEKSYYKTIKTLIDNNISFTLNITGYTLEKMPRKIIDLIIEGIESGIIEVSGTSYTHAILPLLSLDRAYEQISRDRSIKEKILGVRPTIFWPPELAYDPLLPGILQLTGYNQVFIDGEALFYLPRNTYLKEWKNPLKHLLYAQWGRKPIIINYLLGLRELKRSISYVKEGKYIVRGVRDIIGIPVWTQLNALTILSIGEFPFMNIGRASKWIRDLDNVMIYASDIEFYGYRSIGGKILDPIKLVEYIGKLGKEVVHASKLKLIDDQPHYLKTSSWAPNKGLDIWVRDWDNYRVISLYNVVVKETDKYIVENSDILGWEPLPEKKLLAYKIIFENWMEARRGGEG
jgi:predicted glycosyl hydrolase (DUF1957 family)